MQIAILCNFVTLTINFIRMPISDILFLRFSAYFTKKRTAPPPHAEGRRIRRHEFLCMITISKNTPRRAATKMQLWIYCTPPDKSQEFYTFRHNPPHPRLSGRLCRLRYPLRLSNASQTSLTRSSISSIRINVAILYFGGDIHQHVYMTRT